MVQVDLDGTDGVGGLVGDTGILAVLGQAVGAQVDVGSFALLEQLQTGGLVGNDAGDDLVDVDQISVGPIGVLLEDDLRTLVPAGDDELTAESDLVHGGAVVAGSAVSSDALLVDVLLDQSQGTGSEVTHDLALEVLLGQGDFDGVVIDLLQTDIFPLHAVVLGSGLVVLEGVLDLDGALAGSLTGAVQQLGARRIFDFWILCTNLYLYFCSDRRKTAF